MGGVATAISFGDLPCLVLGIVIDDEHLPMIGLGHL